jgi:hypothetical protein
MPIARPPVSAVNVDSTRILYQYVVVPAGHTFLAGSAVAILPSVGSNHYFTLCGAQNHTSLFVGFLIADVHEGETAIVVAGRGSKVTPIVEGGIPLIPGEDVYLAMTAGMVTQADIPIETHTIAFRVGSAISDSELVMSTEFPIVGG